MSGLLAPSDRRYLREFLVARFNLSELRDLCFDLGINSENLPHATLTELARELVAYVERRHQLPCLLVEVLRHRDDTRLAILLSRLRPCDPNRNVQIILPHDHLQNPGEVISKLANFLNIPASEINLIATAPGSTRLLVSLPADAAARLLEFPPPELAGYVVDEVTPFELLTEAQQQAWRGAAWTRPPAWYASWLSGWKLALLSLVVLLGVGAIGVAAVPRITFQNECGRPIQLDDDTPELGSEIAQGRTTLPLWPGEYRAGYDGVTITLQTPAADFGVIRPGVPLAIRLNGSTIPTRGVPESYTIGLGDRVHVTLCPN